MFFKSEFLFIISNQHKSFGICDRLDNHEPAYISFNNSSDIWLAEVHNKLDEDLNFIAVDNCIDYEGKKCDGMLYNSKSIFLIELKSRKIGSSDWEKEAIEQLIFTIEMLKKYHQDKLSTFSVKKAYICNNKRKHFVVIEHSRKKSFWERTEFKLDIQAIIKVK